MKTKAKQSKKTTSKPITKSARVKGGILELIESSPKPKRFKGDLIKRYYEEIGRERHGL